MAMKTYELDSSFRGVSVAIDAGAARFGQFLGFPCVDDGFLLEANGVFLLDADTDRYEASKWDAAVDEEGPAALTVCLRSKDGIFEVRSRLEIDAETGVLSRKDSLLNTDKSAHTVYAAVPRAPLHSGGMEVYGQTGGWCAENDGIWLNAAPGTVELHNTMGRSSENANPYMCVRQKATGQGIATHVLPVGDWVARVKTLAGHKTAYTVIEAGLSDRGLRLGIAPGERLDLPETLYCHFCGEPEEASERFHLYLLKRFPRVRRPGAVYNTWFFCFDEIDRGALEGQLEAAKDVGCRYFVVDAGWFGEGTDWENQVGDWSESRTNAFFGRLSDFADHVRSRGLGFGLWMDPERAAAGSRVYREHRDWFLRGDAIIFDLENPEAAEWLYGEISRLVREYSLSWMKVDCNLRMQKDLTGSNFYRYCRAWNAIMDRVAAENPDCVFEGCASGGHRTDIENMLGRFAGHFISDSVNPLEALRMRRNALPRMLPQFFGTWMVAQQIDFPVMSYFGRDAGERRKTLACADAWWSGTLDLSVDFCMKAMVTGLAGFSGNLASFDEGSRDTMRKWIDFYHGNEGFFSNALCSAHTAANGIDDPAGWLVLQYSSRGHERLMAFAFRLKDNMPRMRVFPKHVEAGKDYSVKIDGEEAEAMGGDRILSQGILVECPEAFSARVIELGAKGPAGPGL